MISPFFTTSTVMLYQCLNGILAMWCSTWSRYISAYFSWLEGKYSCCFDWWCPQYYRALLGCCNYFGKCFDKNIGAGMLWFPPDWSCDRRDPENFFEESVLFYHGLLHLIPWLAGKTSFWYGNYFPTFFQSLVVKIQGDKVVQSALRGSQGTHIAKESTAGVTPDRALVSVLTWNIIVYCCSCNYIQEDLGPVHSHRTAACRSGHACVNSHGRYFLHSTIDGRGGTHKNCT